MILRAAAFCGLTLAAVAAGAQAQETIEVVPLDPLPESEALGEQGPELAPQIHVTQGSAGRLRVLDKITGVVTDLALALGESAVVGHLTITLGDCRFPTDNPAGDAFGELTISYDVAATPIFVGWMIASAPALNALDHPRYDVWMLSCLTS
jgi:hypothetical protein